VLGQSNVRCARAGVSIEDLSEDIARRGLLQGLNVRPGLDAEGVETGMFEVPPAGAAISRSNASSSRSAYARTNMSYIAKTTGLTEVIPLRIEQFPVRFHARYSE
jgi:hypothetical protein